MMARVNQRLLAHRSTPGVLQLGIDVVFGLLRGREQGRVSRREGRGRGRGGLFQGTVYVVGGLVDVMDAVQQRRLSPRHGVSRGATGG